MKIFVAGHKGLVGSAILKRLEKEGCGDIVVKSREELDLLDPDRVKDFFRKEKFDWVFLAAAKVGGIYANNTYPADFLLDNLKIQNNVLEASLKTGVKKLLFLGSSCIYPKNAPQPIKEEYLLSSPLEPTNEPYAIAKIAGIKLCAAINRQYGGNFISVMPCNLYGINDNYHPENAHALPMLIRRFHEAREKGLDEVVIWGTGTPRREFMFNEDLADGVLFLMKNCNAGDVGEFINIGTGRDVTIMELACIIREVTGFRGEIKTDPKKPDGTMRKLLDVSGINALGWSAKTGLREGIEKTYRDFLDNPETRL